MNANELRIGNWVALYFNDEDNEPLLITIEELQHIANKNGHFEPIPLTPDTLLKCGFEKENISFWEYWTKKHTMVLVEWTFKISLDGDECRWIDGNTNVPIYHLHQLQNLWYSLTYTELEINL